MSIANSFRVTLIVACCFFAAGADKSDSYSNNFEQTPPGKPPEDMMILNGVFSVVQIDGNKCLELAADPLDADGVLFGPAGMTTCTVAARVWGESTGRRFPELGIGSNDAGGFKLILVPSQGTLEIRRGEEAKASVPYKWQTKMWTRLKIHVAKTADGKFQIDGKAWPDGAAEPQAWTISTVTDVPPPTGRGSIWGMPYSGKPIRFDDLTSVRE